MRKNCSLLGDHLTRNSKTSITGARQSGILWLSCLSKTKAKIKIFFKKKDKNKWKPACASFTSAALVKQPNSKQPGFTWVTLPGRDPRGRDSRYRQREMNSSMLPELSLGNDAAHNRLGPPTSISKTIFYRPTDLCDIIIIYKFFAQELHKSNYKKSFKKMKGKNLTTFYVRRWFLCLCSEPPWNKVQADGWNYYELLQAITMKTIVGRAMSRRWRELQLQRTTKKPFNRKQGRKQKEKIEITNCFSQTLKLFNFNNTSQKVSPTWRNAFKTCPIKFLHPEYAKNACSSTRRPT